MESKTSESYQKWNTSIFRTARIAGLICILLMISVPIVLTIVFGDTFQTGENIGTTVVNIGIMLLVFAPTAIVENISLYPTLGAGGLILATATGNVSGMKMPAALSAMSTIDAKPGTPEGEVASILAVGFSSIVNNIIAGVSVIFLTQLAPVLEGEVLKPGFGVVFAAVLGAVAIPKIIMSWKQVWPSVVFVSVLYLVLEFFVPSGAKLFSVGKGIIIIIALGISIWKSYSMYKKRPKEATEKASAEIVAQEDDGE